MKNVGRLLSSIGTSILLGAVVGCGNSPFSESLIPTASGHYSSETTGYPGVVMVVLPNGQGMCSGSIVSENAVLTATHCLQDSGTYTVWTQDGYYETTNKKTNGSGNVDDTNDIGLLIFDSPITTDPTWIYPIASSASVGEAVTVVGFGCDNVDTRVGAGVKREGTNVISGKSDYLVLLTPQSSVMHAAIIGDSNQAGTCFGDSGGPLFVANGSGLAIAGVTHAGGSYDQYQLSEFINVADNAANRSFLSQASSQNGLSIGGL